MSAAKELRVIQSLFSTFLKGYEQLPEAGKRKALESLHAKEHIQQLIHCDAAAASSSPPLSSSPATSPTSSAPNTSWCEPLEQQIELLSSSDCALSARYWKYVSRFVAQKMEELQEQEILHMAKLFAPLSPTPSAPPPLPPPPVVSLVADAGFVSTAAEVTTMSKCSSSNSIATSGVVCSDFDIQDIYKNLMSGDALPEMSVMLELILATTEVLSKEANIVQVAVPATLVGDVHGQVRDLKERILPAGGPLETTNYLFLGDYVDRGDASLHTIALLAAAKCMCPRSVFLIRGNHESRNTNGCYGFLSECHSKYPLSSLVDQGSPHTPARTLGCGLHPVWVAANNMFDQLPIAAIVGEKMFCVHGGLSPKATDLATITACNRVVDVAVGGILADLTWSDPYEGLGWAINHRGCGQLFGADVTTRFLEENNLEVLCRAHQCVRSGFMWNHNNMLVTVFSAPNYCGQGNDGAIMKVDAQEHYTLSTYRSSLSWDDDDLDELDIPDGVAGSPVAERAPTLEAPSGPPPAADTHPPEKIIPALFSPPQ